MIDELVIFNFNSCANITVPLNSYAFVLQTCQRKLIVTLRGDSFCKQDILLSTFETSCTGKEAYLFLLEIICGLKSKLVGENEIVNQFKTSYLSYLNTPLVNTQILTILEKLLKDAKEIRSKYLMGLCQKTYSSIARKHMINIHKADKILILGSGSLAADLINQFKKKATIFISARNSHAVEELKLKHDLNSIPWKNLTMIQSFSHIANTIGSDEVLLDSDFFQSWSALHSKRFFVDLSSSNCIQTDMGYHEGVMRLSDIFAEGAIKDNQKKEQLKLAELKMTEIVEKRYTYLKQKHAKQKQYGVNSGNSKAI